MKMNESKIKVGSKVKLVPNEDAPDEMSVEVGIVVHIWLSENGVDDDAYVAFFGEKFPDGKPDKKPYILRYYVNSLELID